MVKDNLDFYENRKLSGDVSVLGVPLDLGKDATGTQLGPAYIRKHGLEEMCRTLGFFYKDLGDIECAGREAAEMGDIKVKYLDEISRVVEKTARIVRDEIKMGGQMLVLGGDHAVSIGSISGASVACEGDLGVIWIDAHGDMMTHENTLSGNIHGMPSSAVMGLGHHTLTDILKPGAKIKKENIIYIGLKDLDQAEIDLIRKEKLHAFTMMDLVREGFGPVTESLLDLQKRVSNIWVSLDVDSIDLDYSPATPMATEGGLTRREISNLTKFIGKLNKIVGLDVVELAPELDKDGKTGKLVIELVAQLLGSDYGWYAHYMKNEEEKQVKRAAI
ncbi:MAG: arginase [Candidatus Magasanikbacteria bacterium]|nr:arginase [Candidatus Magasanikbacteria bacterium]